MRHLLYWLTGFLPVNVIYAEVGSGQEQTAPLFERYHLGTLFGWTFYIHHYLRTDPDRGVHDHPWNWAIAWLLAGEYIERRLTGFNGLGDCNFEFVPRHTGVPYLLTGRDFHSLDLAPGRTVWSLFVHGPFRKGWGFLRPVPWDGDLASRPAAYPSVAYFPFGSDPSEDDGKWVTRTRGRDVERAAA